MKRIIVKIAMLLLLAGSCVVSAAEEVPAGIIVDGQKVTGTVSMRFGNRSGNARNEEVKVDCMAPEAPYSGRIFRMEKRSIGKRELEKALRAVGQSDKGRYGNEGEEMVYTNTARFDPSAAISKEAAEEQAIDIGLKFFDALGVEVVKTPSHVERLYDVEAYLQQQEERLSHMYSDTSVLLDALESQWKRMRKYETRGASYTLVKFDVMVDGMRVWNQPAYPAGGADEPDAWVGFGVSAAVLVSDSGVITEVRTSCIPEIKGSRLPREGELEQFSALLHSQQILPLVLADSWQDALSLVMADNCLGDIGANTEDRPYQNQHLPEPIIAYGSQAVMTEIYPCLFTISEDEWAMFWHVAGKAEFDDGCRY